MRRWNTVAVGVMMFFTTIAHSASPPETAVPSGVPGMQATVIEEPVFNGRAVVYEAGKNHARTVVLVHGIGQAGARDYVDHVPWLVRRYHVIAVDLPGFGQSDKANVIYSPKNYTAFLKHVTDKFARRPFVLVGHSMGGAVALRYAASHPEDLERLVVISPPGILHRYVFAGHYLGQLGIDLLPAAVDPIESIAKLARKLIGKADRRLDLDTVLQSAKQRERYLNGDPHRIAGLAVAIEDFSQDIGNIRIETLVIWGRQDTIAPVRTGKLLAHVLPRARLLIIDDAAHEPLVQTPKHVHALLEPFLGRGLAGIPAVAVAPMEKWPAARCEGKRQIVYEGEYDVLELHECEKILIRDARIRSLNLQDSSVTIENSHIGGGVVGMTVHSATVEMTGGSLGGDIAVLATRGSRVDLAGVEVDAKQAVMQAEGSSEIVFSLSRIRSPTLNGNVHGFFAVSKGRSL